MTDDDRSAREDADADDSRAGDAPLDDLARRTRDRRRGRAGPDADEWNDLFESVERDELDSAAVWEALSDDGADARTTTVGFDATPDSVEKGRTAGRDHVVPKREYCQRCPYFADPPQMACTHDGTAIVEVLDTERFRVRDCPVAAEGGLSPAAGDESGDDAEEDVNDRDTADAAATGADSDADAPGDDPDAD